MSRCSPPRPRKIRCKIGSGESRQSFARIVCARSLPVAESDCMRCNAQPHRRRCLPPSRHSCSRLLLSTLVLAKPTVPAALLGLLLFSALGCCFPRWCSADDGVAGRSCAAHFALLLCMFPGLIIRHDLIDECCGVRAFLYRPATCCSALRFVFVWSPYVVGCRF